MIADAIEILLSNIPIVMFIAAILIATLTKAPADGPLRYFNWLLLLSVGVEALWGGLFHVFFPDMASAQIGWRPSPYEYEIGVADISLGLVAIAAFWCSLSFKSAIAIFAVLFDIGVLIGHIQQVIAAGNMSFDNMGPLQLVTALHIVLMPILLVLIWRGETPAASRSLT